MELLSAHQIAHLTGDQLDSLLERIRLAESQLKAVQLRVLREVDRRQVPLGDGMRTLEDWIVGAHPVGCGERSEPHHSRQMRFVPRHILQC